MTTDPSDGHFDLSRVAAALGDESAYADLVQVIERCTHHRSVVEDLRVAVAILNQLIAMGPGGPDAVLEDGDDLVRQSLFVNVVMHYCRATDSTDPGRRFKGGVEKGYTAELRAAHKRLTNLRNKVLAHHGAAADQDWTDDRLVLAINGPVFSYHAVFERMILTRAALRDLRAVLPVAFTHVSERARQVEIDLNDRIQALSDDPVFRRVLASSEFDPAAYFGTEEMVEAFRAGGDPGDFKGHTRWTRPDEAD